MSDSQAPINDKAPLNRGVQQPMPPIPSTPAFHIPKEEATQSKTEGRFLFVDAIRGIAAICVVMRHLFFSGYQQLEPIFPTFLSVIHKWGAAGVYAFFVLSGFVIAHSLRKNSLSGSAVGNFILRRQIRLDPVYWAVLGIIVAPLTIKALLGRGEYSGPSATNVLANMFYLQGLLNVKAVIGIAWTLCIEIQFYLIFILLLLIGSKATRLHADFNISKISVGILFALGTVSLAVKHFSFHPAYFIYYWHFFALGALAYWAMQRAISPTVFFIFAGMFGIDTFLSDPKAIGDFGSSHSLSIHAMCVGLITAISLYYAGTHGLMGRWGRHPIFQYLGRISYSLYLIHLIVIAKLGAIFFPLMEKNSSFTLVWYFSVFVVSIIAAHLLFLLVEKPSMKLASRLKSPKHSIS